MSSEIDSKRPQFGQRYLRDDDDVFRHNAWDEVVWTEEQEAEAAARVTEQAKHLVDFNKMQEYISKPSTYWDSFYTVHTNRFFKDRHWLFTEFPEIVNDDCLKSETLAEVTDSNGLELKGGKSVEEIEHRAVLEVGCGVGNTVFPILEYSADKNQHLYCCDFSSNAIDLLKENPLYDPKRCTAFVCDLTGENWEAPFAENSLDVIIAVFVLSAIHPEKLGNVVKSMYRYLKPGGMVAFRDFGRFDMTQMRFKNGRCLQENLYARGDGTLAYFFTQDEVRSLFTSCRFIEKMNIVDRRLLVNRGQKLKMYRVWIQAKYIKPKV